MPTPDYVERRIVIEYGRQYAYIYMTTGDGKMLPGCEESFRQPYQLERKEAAEEAAETWHLVYQHINDTINVPLQEDADDKPESGLDD